MKNLGLYLLNSIYGFISHKGTTYSLLGGINMKGNVVALMSIYSRAEKNIYTLFNFFAYAGRDVRVVFLNLFAYAGRDVEVVILNLFAHAGRDVEVWFLNLFAHAGRDVRVWILNLFAHAGSDVMVWILNLFAHAGSDVKVGFLNLFAHSLNGHFDMEFVSFFAFTGQCTKLRLKKI